MCARDYVVEGEMLFGEFLVAVLAGVAVSEVDVVSGETDREGGVAVVVDQPHHRGPRKDLADRVNELARMRAKHLHFAEVSHAGGALPRNHLERLVALA